MHVASLTFSNARGSCPFHHYTLSVSDTQLTVILVVPIKNLRTFKTKFCDRSTFLIKDILITRIKFLFLF